eukprot:c10931_g1_i6.p2 GENE.c10931_g1_i6~~c10931_g1_i6.p2  ORF type:complete len:103 (+),score=22.26 c10931_g1_i6:180-488(+)
MSGLPSRRYKPLKIILIGNSGVGKTCLFTKFFHDYFSQSTFNTVGIDFKIFDFQFRGHKHKAQVWDTAGQERFRTINKSHIRGAHAVIVIDFPLDFLQKINE